MICEADIDDFEVINRSLVERGCFLYDVTELHHLSDGALGWFYPVYINRKLDFVRPKAFWEEKDNDKAIRLQIDRRKAILDINAKILDGIRNPQKSTQKSTDLKQQIGAIGRNQPCPCGSGRRYKHCHGAFGGG